MPKFYVSVTGGFVSTEQREHMCHIIKTRLIENFGSELSVVNSYLEHWDRLQDGDESAERMIDSWSDAWNAAQDGLFDGWHTVPECMFEMVLA